MCVIRCGGAPRDACDGEGLHPVPGAVDAARDAPSLRCRAPTAASGSLLHCVVDALAGRLPGVLSFRSCGVSASHRQRNSPSRLHVNHVKPKQSRGVTTSTLRNGENRVPNCVPNSAILTCSDWWSCCVLGGTGHRFGCSAFLWPDTRESGGISSVPRPSGRSGFCEMMIEAAHGTASAIRASKTSPWRRRSRPLRTCA